MATRVVGFLAILTGLCYLGAVIRPGLPWAAIPRHTLENAVLLVFLAAGVGGLLLASWRWERLGAAISVLSGLVLGWLIYTISEDQRLIAAFVYASPFFTAGALHLYRLWRYRRASAKTVPE
jgi:hypothetical protein